LKVELELTGIVLDDVVLDHNSTCSVSRLPH
jgi:hypothetical protein